MKQLIGVLVAGGALALAACGGDDEGDLTVFCDRIEELRAVEDPVASLESGDVEAAKETLEESQMLFAGVAEAAPEEIRDDVERSRAFFDEFVRLTEGAEAPEDFLDAATELEDEGRELQETNAQLQEFTDENCGEDSSESSAGDSAGEGG